MKNKSVINTPLNSAVLLPTSGNRARNTLSQLAANHVSLPSAQLQHRLWSGMAVTFVTIAATRSSCQQSVPVPATSAHYPLVPRCDPEVSTSVRHKQYLKLLIWWPVLVLFSLGSKDTTWWHNPFLKFQVNLFPI